MKKKLYIIQGDFKGMWIESRESAYSPKQAKLKAAFHNKLSGGEIREFIKNKGIKVIR